MGNDYFPLMELNKDLIKSLIERAGGLNGRLNSEIEKSIKFCRFCSEHGLFCDVADQTPFEERKRLIVIGDSLKQVQNILLFLQKLQSWQLRDRDEAFDRLEDSRLALMDLVKGYQGKKVPDVLKELNACFGLESSDSVECLKEILKKKDDEPRWPLAIRKLFLRLKWKKAVGIALKFFVFSATISSMARLSSRRRVSSFLDSTKAEIRDNLLTISSSPHLNVFHGRG